MKARETWQKMGGGAVGAPAGLSSSAKTALLWGGGFTLLRDVLQFVVMLVLVRLLTPKDYGSAAVAQSILGLVAVGSFSTFVMHALQLRDPSTVDWQAHFSAALIINLPLFVLTEILAWVLWLTATYHEAAIPLAAGATTLIIEIPATLRHRMLETRHEWRRFRLLLMFGTLLGLGVGLLVAFLGGGVWALIVQAPLFGLPAAVDLFWGGGWRPTGTWSWQRYRETAWFGFNRMGSALVVQGRRTLEQTLIGAAYDLATLGKFSRSMGLATLLAGRIGTVVTGALYPVVTRAEHRSPHFQRLAGLIVCGVCWTTLPAAIFLAWRADLAVAVLYGPQWLQVAAWLPYAVAGIALNGIAATASSLLLANNEVKANLGIDLLAASLAMALALWVVPLGISRYLAALAGHGLFVMLLTLGRLRKSQGIARRALAPAFLPPLIAGAGAVELLEAVWTMQVPVSLPPFLQLAADGFLFGLLYLLILRIAAPGAMRALLHVAPGGQHLQTWLLLRPVPFIT